MHVTFIIVYTCVLCTVHVPTPGSRNVKNKHFFRSLGETVNKKYMNIILGEDSPRRVYDARGTHGIIL